MPACGTSYMSKNATARDCSIQLRLPAAGLRASHAPQCLLVLCSALKEANIPAGPRLIILHHLERYRHVLKPGMPMPTAQQMPHHQPMPPQPVPQPRR